MKKRLQAPFSDIVGCTSPVQQAIKLIWGVFEKAPIPDNKSEKSQSTARVIMLHLLSTMKSIGMINSAGYHSTAITLLRSIEDALDCFCAVIQDETAAEQWLNGKLKASDAARGWTINKTLDGSIMLGEYRKSIRNGLNRYSHCTPAQTNWNLYRKNVSDNQCTVELNYQHAVISVNGYYIDRYLCIHLYELIDVIQMYYSNYLLDNPEISQILNKYGKDVEQIITDFLKDINSDKLYMDIPPELVGLIPIE